VRQHAETIVICCCDAKEAKASKASVTAVCIFDSHASPM
jgi:hypothetical protein